MYCPGALARASVGGLRAGENETEASASNVCRSGVKRPFTIPVTGDADRAQARERAPRRHALMLRESCEVVRASGRPFLPDARQQLRKEDGWSCAFCIS